MKASDETILLHMKQLVKKFDQQPGLAIQTMNLLKPSDFVKFFNQLNQSKRDIRIIALELLLHFFLSPVTIKSHILEILNLNFGLIILNNIPNSLCKNPKNCRNILESVQNHYKKMKSKPKITKNQKQSIQQRCWLYCFADQSIKEYQTFKKQTDQIDPHQYLIFMEVYQEVEQQKTTHDRFLKTMQNNIPLNSHMKEKNIIDGSFATKYIKPPKKIDQQNRQ